MRPELDLPCVLVCIPAGTRCFDSYVLSQREVFVPQSYEWGVEAQCDWYEGYAFLGDERIKLQVFEMRSMAGGGAYHRAYTHATQQAFLEAHEFAFHYFDGVFKLLRYDNLKAVVKKVLHGYRREETSRFIAFRSHRRFQSEFCNPARGNEKGGVEGEGGYFRRNHWVPLPSTLIPMSYARHSRSPCLGVGDSSRPCYYCSGEFLQLESST